MINLAIFRPHQSPSRESRALGGEKSCGYSVAWIEEFPCPCNGAYYNPYIRAY